MSERMTDTVSNNSVNSLTSGPIFLPLIKFALPVLLALVLQAMYGAVDLMVVGRFGTPADQSAVAVGSQLMTTVTGVITAFAMGTTILLGQRVGQGRGDEGGKAVGASIMLFLTVGVAVTAFLVVGADLLSGVMHAPEEAFAKTSAYVRICGGGSLIIIFYNLIGAIFRGIGDSRTPLITVSIACAVNIVGDLVFCAGFGMGAAGAAIATVLAQAVGVVASFLLIRRRELGFAFRLSDIRFDGNIIKQITAFGAPVALQELLVGVSFLVISAIVNNIGLIESAGVGVAEKVCMFIMLIPSSFMQSLAAIVAQNYGAGKLGRAYKTLGIAFILSIVSGAIMFALSFFRGDMLAGIFSNDAAVIAAAADYLKAYAIDCFFTAFLFCFVGFYNGVGRTGFVMAQGLAGAFLVRVPLSFLFSGMEPVSLFRIGLSIPCSTVVQITMCVIYLILVRRKLLPHGGRERGDSADARIL